MWVGVKANYSRGFSYYKETTGSRQYGGHYQTTGVQYTGLQIEFVPENTMEIKEQNGNIVHGTAEGIVSRYWFSGHGITPGIGDFVMTGTTQYRVVGIQDLANVPGAGIYGLYLRRDEIAI